VNTKLPTNKDKTEMPDFQTLHNSISTQLL